MEYFYDEYSHDKKKKKKLSQLVLYEILRDHYNSLCSFSFSLSVVRGVIMVGERSAHTFFMILCTEEQS